MGRSKEIKNRPTILLVHGGVEKNSPQGIRYSHFIKHLSKDYNIETLSIKSSIEFQEVKKHYEVLPLLNFKVKKTLLYVSKKYFNHFIFPDTLSLYLRYYKKALKRIFKRKDIQIVIIGVSPFSLLKLSGFIKQNFETKVVLDMADPFSFNINYLNNDKLQNKAIAIEKQSISKVDMVVVLNNSIKEKYSHLNKNVLCLEQGIDQSFLNKQKRNQPGRYIEMVYAGRFYEGIRTPNTLISTINSNFKKIKLTIFKGEINKKYNSEEYGFVKKRDAVPNELMPKTLSEFDVIVFIDNFKGVQVPGKLLECIALKKPVLFIYENSFSPSLDYIKNEKNIFLCKNTEKDISKEIENIVNYLSDNIYYYRSLKPNLDSYLWENLSEKLRRELIKIV